jgi:hypothetical protein
MWPRFHAREGIRRSVLTVLSRGTVTRIFPRSTAPARRTTSTDPGFENPERHQYEEITSPYSGLVQVLKPDGLYQSQQRFGLYRWHIPDPIRFASDLRVTIQALGWRSGGRYLPLTDDISSVAF